MSEQPQSSAWSRLLRMARPRATRANALAALLALGLGFAIAAQVQQTDQSGLEQLREDELVRILDDVSSEQNRLANDTRALEVTRDRLVSGADSSEEALKAAQDRLDTLGILTGTRPATGPGIVITIADPGHKVTAALLLDALQELRDAGAEAIQIGSARVVASTAFTDVAGGVAVDTLVLRAPYTVVAIGDGQTMATALEIPGGVIASMPEGAHATVATRDEVEVTALHATPDPAYARPAATATAQPSGS